MGARRSTAQKGVFYQIVGVFTVAKAEFSKGELKRFTRLLFLHFPKTTSDHGSSIPFGDEVCTKFTDLAQSGNMKAAKFTFWLQQIKAALLEIRGVQKGQRGSSECFPQFAFDYPFPKSQIPSSPGRHP